MGVFSLFSKNNNVEAQTRQAPITRTPLTGWGWSSNIGWISFSSVNKGSGGGNYEVSLLSTGALSGYAWSSNIGWIKFAGDGSHPNPTVDRTTGAVSGWARACAGTINGDCTGVSRTDSWDGWIELAGANHPTVQSLNGTDTSSQGVSFNVGTGKFSGYAWGSDVIGWVTFNPSIGTEVTCAPNCGGTVSTTLTGSCVANPSSLSATGPVDFTITPSGGSGSYTSNGWTSGPTLTRTFPSITPPATFPVSVQDTSSPSNSGTINCSVAGSVGGDAKMWLNNDPARAKTSTKVRVGQTAKVNWLLDDYIVQGLTSCKGVTSQNVPVWQNQVITDENHDNGDLPTAQSSITGLPKGVYVLRIRCEDPGNNAINADTNSVTIIVTDSVIEEI